MWEEAEGKLKEENEISRRAGKIQFKISGGKKKIKHEH